MTVGKTSSAPKPPPRSAPRSDAPKSPDKKAPDAKAADPKAADLAAKAEAKAAETRPVEDTRRVEETRKADEATVTAARQSAKRVEDQAKVNALKPAKTVEPPVRAGIAELNAAARPDAVKPNADVSPNADVKPSDDAPAKSPVERAAEETRRVEADRAEKLPDAEKRLAEATRVREEREADLARVRAEVPAAEKPAAEKPAAEKPAAEKPVRTEAERVASERVTAAEKALDLARADESTAKAEIDRLNKAVTDAHAKLAAETKADTARAIERPDERQEIVNRLARAAEVAGVEGSKTMGAAAADVVRDAGGPGAAKKLAPAIEQSIVEGNGALFGARTAEALATTRHQGVRDIAGATAQGIKQVKAEFDAAQAKAGKRDADLANFMATHGASLSGDQRAVAQKEFADAAAKDRAELDAASEKLLSVAQGADVARNNGHLSGLMGDRVAGAGSLMRDVRAAVPAALKTDAGQAHLRSVLKSAPAGALPTHLVAENAAEAKALAPAVAGAVINEEKAKRDGLIDDVGKHGAQLGMPELENQDVLGAMKRIAASDTPAAFKSGLSALGNSLKALKGFGKTSPGAAGLFGGVLGTAGALASGLDGKSVKDIAEATTKFVHSASSVAAETLDLVGKSSEFAGNLAKQFGRGAGVFDGLNALGALAEGDVTQAGISLASAAGAALSTLGREGLKRAVGGALGLSASVAQVGYDLYKSGQEREAYREQVQGIFEKIGFDKRQAALLSYADKSTADTLSHLGRGQAPGGGDLPPSAVLDRMRNLSEADMEQFVAAHRMLTDDAGKLQHDLGGVLPDRLFRNLNDLRLRLFGAQAA